jgi:YD repeat-containing protein
LAADPRPIVILHHQINPSLETPTWSSVQLQFNATTGSTYYYNTSQFIPGDIAAIAVQANVPTLVTDRYPHTATVVDDRSGTLTTTVYSGNAILVNESTNAFGDGWTLQNLLRIKANPSGGGGVILNLGSGQAEWFAGSPGTGGNYTSPAGDFSTLTKTSSGYTRTLTDGTQQVFDSSGNETSSIDRNGLATTYAYSSGLLQSITDPYNNPTTFSYSSGKLSSIQDPAGRRTTFTFSGNNLAAVWQNDGTQDLRTSYTYDSSGRMTQYQDSLSHVVSIAYDSGNRAGTITRPDSSPQTVTAYQEEGFNTSGTLSNPACPTLLAEAQASYTDPLGNTTGLRSDWHGLGLTGQTTDAEGDVATNDSDGNGLATIVIDNL